MIAKWKASKISYILWKWVLFTNTVFSLCSPKLKPDKSLWKEISFVALLCEQLQISSWDCMEMFSKTRRIRKNGVILFNFVSFIEKDLSQERLERFEKRF